VVRTVTAVFLLGLLAAGLQSAASAAPGRPVAAARSAERQGRSPALARTSYNATVTSFDGTAIAITVFVPHLPANTTAPLIVQQPGWGGTRFTSLDGINAGSIPTDYALKMAYDEGYFVISYDPRGFGGSGGKAHVMSPRFEGKDIIAILNWAQANLGPQLAYQNGKPVVGAIGYSYGGGFQLLGAALDPRFVAIVPTATWNYLPYSLDPSGDPKSIWLDLLFGTGLEASEGRYARPVYQGYEEAQTGTVDQSVLNFLAPNGLNGFCNGTEGTGIPHVSAFLVQGAGDTLFNMNEALANAACLRSVGNDVRLLIQRQGHTLPILQVPTPGSAFGFSIDHHVQCGSANYDTAHMMLSFLDEKLRGVPSGIPVPENCIVQDDTHGLVVTSIPVGGTSATVPSTEVIGSPLANAVIGQLQTQTIAEVKAELKPLRKNVVALVLAVLAGLESPSSLNEDVLYEILEVLPPQLVSDVFAPESIVPLYTSSAGGPLAGVPTMNLQVTADLPSTLPIAYFGIGVRHQNGSQTVLVDSQLTPIRGAGTYQQNMVGISTQLRPGDQVDLLIYGYHPQYLNDLDAVPVPFHVSGTVALPLD